MIGKVKSKSWVMLAVICFLFLLVDGYVFFPRLNVKGVLIAEQAICDLMDDCDFRKEYGIGEEYKYSHEYTRNEIRIYIPDRCAHLLHDGNFKRCVDLAVDRALRAKCVDRNGMELIILRSGSDCKARIVRAILGFVMLTLTVPVICIFIVSLYHILRRIPAGTIFRHKIKAND